MPVLVGGLLSRQFDLFRRQIPDRLLLAFGLAYMVWCRRACLGSSFRDSWA